MASAVCRSRRLPCRSNPCLLGDFVRNLHQRVVAVDRTRFFIKQPERGRIFIAIEKRRLHRGEEPSSDPKCGPPPMLRIRYAPCSLRTWDCRIRAVRFHSVRRQQFLESVGVSVLQQIARLLPAENVERRHAPGGAGVVALAHEEFQEQRRQIEAATCDCGSTDRTEEAPGSGASQEVLLIRRLVVRVSGREHHALDAQFHHFVEESPNALWIGTVEQRCVGGNAETAGQRFLDSF